MSNFHVGDIVWIHSVTLEGSATILEINPNRHLSYKLQVHNRDLIYRAFESELSELAPWEKELLNSSNESTMKTPELQIDGTYLRRGDEIINYAERWGYGYIVATTPIERIPLYELSAHGAEYFIEFFSSGLSGLFGISTHGDEIYMDHVEHFADLESASARAREFNQTHIWDLREQEEIELASEEDSALKELADEIVYAVNNAWDEPSAVESVQRLLELHEASK